MSKCHEIMKENKVLFISPSKYKDEFDNDYYIITKTLTPIHMSKSFTQLKSSV